MATTFSDDFFRSIHDAEFDRRDKHDSADGFLLAVVTLLGGVGFYYLDILPTSKLQWWDWTFIAFATCFSTAWVIAVVCLAGSIWPRFVGYLSDPNELESYAIALQEFHAYHEPGEAGEKKAECELREFARKQYVESADVNRLANQRKQKWQTRAKIASISAVGLVLVNAPFGFFVKDSRPKVESVRLVQSLTGHNVRIIEEGDSDVGTTGNETSRLQTPGTANPTPNSYPQGGSGPRILKAR